VERLAIDTSFLIDLQNEHRRRGEPLGAVAFLEQHEDTELLLPSVALGEYLEGFADPDSGAARALVSSLRILDVTADVARVYAKVTRGLRATGQLIGANDLWIACTAKAAGVPIITRNAEHFARVPGLEVIRYGAADTSET
jgi:predicted nucleic acid-binding protein